MVVKPGFQKTELGHLPNGWSIKKFSDFCLLQRGFDLTETTRIPGDVPVYSSSGISYYHKQAKENPPGVVTGRKGQLGEVYFIEEPYWPHDTTLWVQNFRKNDPKFVYWYLKYFHLERFDAATSVPTLNRNNLSGIEISIPQPTEQRVIATAISDADTQITSLEQVIAKKRDLKQAAMQELLTGKRRLPGFSEEWEVKRLRDLLGYERPDNYIVKSTEYIENAKTPVLTANKSFILGYTNEEFGIYNKSPVIIFDDFTTDCKYVDFPFKVKSSAIKLLKSKDNADLKFIFEKMRITPFSLGDHKRYYISEYQNIEIMVPSMVEQCAIATFLSDMDAELTALEQKRDKTKAIKQGMMRELLTGRIRLT